MALGTAIHAAIEGLTKPVRPVEQLRRAFAREVALLPTDEVAADPDALKDGETMLATYMREVMPTFTPTMTEQPFAIRAEGVLVTGIIDAADEEDVHDTKTTALISKFNAANHQVQLTLYSWGYAALTGHAPKRLLLDVLPRGGKVRYRQIEVEPAHAEVRDLVRLTRFGILSRDFQPTGLLNGSCQFCPFTKVCEFYVQS